MSCCLFSGLLGQLIVRQALNRFIKMSIIITVCGCSQGVLLFMGKLTQACVLRIKVFEIFVASTMNSSLSVRNNRRVTHSLPSVPSINCLCLDLAAQ